MQHALIAVAIQSCTWALTGSWLVGAAAGLWYFVGREYAQAEYRLIEHFYFGRRADMPFLAPLRDKRAWNKKSMLDWVLPMVAVTAVWLLFR